MLDFFVYRSCINIHSLSPHHPPRIYEKIFCKCFYFRKLVILCLLSLALNGFCLFSFAFGEITVFTLLRRFKKTVLALSFSVLLCQATLFRQSHICICSFLFRLLSSNLRKNTSQVLVFSYCYSWVFLSISFVFLSIVSRFLCNFLDVMQFSRYNLLLHIFSDFFVSLRRPFNHIFVYALSSSPRLPRTHLKLFCKRGFASLFGVFYTQKCLQSFLFLLLKVEPSKLNSSLFSP